MGYAAEGWRWHVGLNDEMVHRALDHRSACGVLVRGTGRKDSPGRRREVCERCARATKYHPRKVGQMTVVRVSVLRTTVRALRGAGIDPAVVIRKALHEAAQGLPAPTTMPVSRDLELKIHAAGEQLLPDHRWKGVPAAVLARRAGVTRAQLRTVLGRGRSVRAGSRTFYGYLAADVLALGIPPEGRAAPA